jgi:hypothetical protein
LPSPINDEYPSEPRTAFRQAMPPTILTNKNKLEASIRALDASDDEAQRGHRASELIGQRAFELLAK